MDNSFFRNAFCAILHIESFRVRLDSVLSSSGRAESKRKFKKEYPRKTIDTTIEHQIREIFTLPLEALTECFFFIFIEKNYSYRS